MGKGWFTQHSPPSSSTSGIQSSICSIGTDNHQPSADGVSTKPCQAATQACVAAWQGLVDTPSALGWWLSVPIEQIDDWMPLVDEEGGECCVNQPLPTWAEPSDQGAAGDVTDALSPLQQMALLALHQEER